MTGEAAATSDLDERGAFYDRALEYTPFLATAAGGALFLVKTEDKHIGRSLFMKQGRGEFMVLSRAVAAIKGLQGPEAVEHRTFIDVGANIGTTTVPAILSHGFESAVAMEPEPENLRVLRLNLVLNELEDRVKALPVAVSNEIGHSDLVVNPERGGKHWIATDPAKIKRKASDAETHILEVETVTIDHLVDGGLIDADRTGLLWIDAEAHEGHILEGASSLLERGTPIVLEWAAENLDRMGDRSKLEQAITENYTHFAEMHRSSDSSKAAFPLNAVGRLPAFAENLLDPSISSNLKTDVLVMRLERAQAKGVKDLGMVLKQHQVSVDGKPPDPAPKPKKEGAGDGKPRDPAPKATRAAPADGKPRDPDPRAKKEARRARKTARRDAKRGQRAK